MTQDEIIEMARQAASHGVENHRSGEVSFVFYNEHLMNFAKLVADKEREHYDDLFAHIKGWCEAYPISVFPEPDFKKAHEVLKANGMTLDAISASNMKHVITQVQKMIDAAIRARGEA
jgi:hypothetical protein